MKILRSLSLLLALTFLLSSARSAWAGPVNARHISPDAKWYLHLDAEAFRKTALYDKLLADAKGQAGFADKLDQLTAVLGMNPLTDISGVTLYNDSFEPQQVAILIYAKVDGPKLTAAVSNCPDFKSTDRGTHTLLSWTDPNDSKDKYACIYDESLVVMGSRMDLLKKAVDVLDARKDPGGRVIKDLPKAAFLEASADQTAVSDERMSKLLSQADVASLTASETDGKVGVTLTVTGRDGEKAGLVAKAAEFFIGLGQTNEQAPAVVKEMLKEIKVSVLGTSVRATLVEDVAKLHDNLKALIEARQEQGDAQGAGKL